MSRQFQYNQDSECVYSNFIRPICKHFEKNPELRNVLFYRDKKV